MQKKRYNIPETLDKILGIAMEKYEKNNDLGNTLFVFASDDIYELPMTRETLTSEVSEYLKHRVVQGLAIVGLMDINEAFLDKNLQSMEMPVAEGMPSVGIVYKGFDELGKPEDYMFYTFILRHDLEQLKEEPKKFKYSEIRRKSSKDGLTLTDNLFEKIFPILRPKQKDEFIQ